MPFWHRAAIAGVVILSAAIVAKVVDSHLARRRLAPGAVTRYRVLRRAVMTTIVFVGLLSALLVIPQVRAVAGGILASSAVLAIVIGFASQRTIGNAVAGLMIAFTQPLRIGDRVKVGDVEGTVEEIGLTYTFIRAEGGARLVTPNEKLASDAIVNYTIRSPATIAEVNVKIPLAQDLDAVVDALRAETQGEVFVSALDGDATITLREPAASQEDAERIQRDLRLRAARRLRAAGIYA
jgi:small-conductance mechanosensitive channel